MILQTTVQLVRSDWQVKPTLEWAGLKSVLMDNGELFVTAHGLFQMPM